VPWCGLRTFSLLTSSSERWRCPLRCLAAVSLAWNCAICTFANQGNTFMCEMCGTARPGAIPMPADLIPNSDDDEYDGSSGDEVDEAGTPVLIAGDEDEEDDIPRGMLGVALPCPCFATVSRLGGASHRLTACRLTCSPCLPRVLFTEPWACPACTLENAGRAFECDACGTARP
jgi:hypothetical protein